MCNTSRDVSTNGCMDIAGNYCLRFYIHLYYISRFSSGKSKPDGWTALESPVQLVWSPGTYGSSHPSPPATRCLAGNPDTNPTSRSVFPFVPKTGVLQVSILLLRFLRGSYPCLKAFCLREKSTSSASGASYIGRFVLRRS